MHGFLYFSPEHWKSHRLCLAVYRDMHGKGVYTLFEVLHGYVAKNPLLVTSNLELIEMSIPASAIKLVAVSGKQLPEDIYLFARVPNVFVPLAVSAYGSNPVEKGKV